MNEWIAGKHAVFHALKAGRRTIERVFVASRLKDKDSQNIIELAKKNKVRLESKDFSFIAKHSPIEIHQGVLAEVSKYKYVDLESLIDRNDTNNNRPILVLDEVQDPHHVGALIRSAYCFGFKGCILPDSNASGVTATAAKSSSGAVEYMKISRVSSLAKSLDFLKESEYWIYGTDADTEKSLYEQRFDSKTVVVVGSEGRGMRRLVREKCDFLVSIPIRGEISSLSVSAAGSIFMAEVGRKLPKT